MSPLTQWTRLVRYISSDDSIKYGEPIDIGVDTDIQQLAHDGGLVVNVLEGVGPLSASPTGRTETVKVLLGPFTPADVPIIRCVGLNYKSHSRCDRYLEPSRTSLPS